MRGTAGSKSALTARWPLISGLAALLLAGSLGALIYFREQNGPFGFEARWMSELVEDRSPVLTALALVFNSLGGGILAIAVIPVGIIVALILWRRPWAALYFAVSALSSVGVVRLLKSLFGRPRPDDILVRTDFGSFPSGHSANAALIAATMGVVFPRLWVWAAGAVYTVAMMLSRTYLGAHWITDTVGGLLVGLGVAVIVWAPFARLLDAERRMPHPPPWQRGPRG